MWRCSACGADLWLPACGSPHPSRLVVARDGSGRFSCAEWGVRGILES